MSKIDIIQKLKSNIEENKSLLEQFISSKYYADTLNNLSKIAIPIKTKCLNNKIIVKFHHLKHKNIGIKIHLKDVEIADNNFEKIFKEKLKTEVNSTDNALKNIEDAASKIAKQFNEKKFK